MTRKPLSESEASEVLQRGLEISHELTCEQAQALLPAFIAAERAGVDVDNEPAYAALLRHLDESPECADLYAAMADQLDALEGAAEQLPPVPTTLPRFFEETAQGGTAVLRVLKGLTTRFGLTLSLPRLGPPVSTMGGGDSVTLFSDTLETVERTPELEVTLYPYGEAPELVVSLREQRAVDHWRIQLQLGDAVYTAVTEDQGEARISGFSEADVRAVEQLELLCTEVPEDEA